MIIRGIASVAVMPLVKACETLDRLLDDEYEDEYGDEDGYDEDDI
jgi:hypothetical protein